MTLYLVTVERTITAEVVVEADTGDLAERLAEDRADTGHYDDVWMNLDADARHVTYGATEADGTEDES